MSDLTNKLGMELDMDALNLVTGGVGGSKENTIVRYCPKCKANKKFIVYKGGRLQCPDCPYQTTEV